MSVLVTLLYTVLLILISVYLWYQYKFTYWKNRKVRGPKPKLFFGNMSELFNKQTMGKVFEKLYNSNKDEPFVGIYMFHKPALLINNLDLAKFVMLKDFSHFVDHGFKFLGENQPMMHHLLNLNGGRWKALRNKVSPAFTSTKMKYMFHTMAACGEEMSDFLKNDAAIGSSIDIKDIMARFNTDVIVSCAFGIDSNSFKHPNAEFNAMGRRVFNMGFKRSMYLMMGLFAPEFLKMIDGKVVEDHVSDFFIKVVDDTIKYREKNNVTRNDLMQLLIKIKNNESIDDNKDINKEETGVDDIQINTVEIAALAFGFFGGGFDTSSTTLSYLCYELAKNPDIQSSIRKEIDDMLEKYDNKITYEAVHEMTCIDRVIEETLRLYPPAPLHFRICTKNYVIPHTNVTIEKDTLVLIPILGYHKDPKLFPNPEVFDPERFTPENKKMRHNFSHLPFGDGPRMCIGNKLAMTQILIGVIYILKNYELSIDSNHVLQVDPYALLLTPKNMIITIKNRT